MLSISNSFFTKKPQRRWTWISPNGYTRNEIDFVLSSCKYILNDVGIINKINFHSDHRPLRAKLAFNFKIHRHQMIRNQIKKLCKQTLIGNSDRFDLELKNSFSLLDIGTSDTQVHYDNIKDSIKTATRAIKQNRTKTDKLTSDTLKLIAHRTNTQRHTDEFKNLDRKVKRSIRKDLRNYNTNVIKSALECGGSLRAAKDGITKGKTWITCLRDPNGVKQNDRERVANICTDFYKNLYSDPSRPAAPIEYFCSDTIPVITEHEVDIALKSMKYNKSPGEDGVSTEILKIFKNTLIPHVTTFFNTILRAPTGAQLNYRRYRYDFKAKIVPLDRTLLLVKRHQRFGVPHVDHQVHQQEPSLTIKDSEMTPKQKFFRLDGALLLSNRHRRFGVSDVDHQLHQQEPS
ncbi:hypothetical protein NE865_01447 [Phthorimaea operculella]|nr:hypothetical protein NE865_01447 [Phthorimaea operculella]